MQLKFGQVKQQKKRKKALARLKAQLKENMEGRAPRGDGVPVAGDKPGDEHQRKRARSPSPSAMATPRSSCAGPGASR